MVPAAAAATGRKVVLPESFDDWDDFDLGLSITKTRAAAAKPNVIPITKPAVSVATTTATTTSSTVLNARKKSLFDDDVDDVL